LGLKCERLLEKQNKQIDLKNEKIFAEVRRVNIDKGYAQSSVKNNLKPCELQERDSDRENCTNFSSFIR